MLLLGSTKTEGASCGFVVTLRYRLAAACPSMVWLLQLPSLHTQREGKLMKILTRIIPSNVSSEWQAVFATVCCYGAHSS